MPAELTDPFKVLWQSGIAALPVEPEELEPFNAHHLRQGRDTGAHELMRAISSLQAASRTIVRTSLTYDAVISPTMAQPPVPLGAFADLDPEAIRNHALQQLEGLF
jgi:amidase